MDQPLAVPYATHVVGVSVSQCCCEGVIGEALVKGLKT
jgi:hypothetical protein